MPALHGDPCCLCRCHSAESLFLLVKIEGVGDLVVEGRKKLGGGWERGNLYRESLNYGGIMTSQNMAASSNPVTGFSFFFYKFWGKHHTDVYISLGWWGSAVGSTIHSYIVRTDHLSTHTTIDYSNFFFFLHR